MAYSHLLIAIDLTEDCHLVLEKAHKLRTALSCKATLVHVVEPLTMAFGGDVPMDLSLLQEQQTEQAQEKLNILAEQHELLKENNCHLRYGQPRQEIHLLAKEQNCDLIIVGSHGRHGLALLLGSTTNDLLSGAPCDVLAIDLKDHANE
ncbi:universal stress protein [Denitrificimonas sp. JX-1]|uniref:Universal stress protein n=1 Tax=Denitrificimonas halotolerans TaxID=3098930 RepID=A0ABU5GRP6_9GAMM|nr:universal stress protein [Denitrificimonas sp. JX-1]MDY7219045.1 universal stress protein [Denitrificimonas sp. JX-1]